VANVDARVQIVGDGPPVVLLHGGPNSGSTWAPLLPALTAFRCYVIDRPGTGLSDDFILTGNLRAFACRFVPQIMDELGLERAHLVASSFGGFLALMSTTAAPDRVHRMVQMACPAFVPGMTAPGFMKAMSLKPVRWLMNTLPPNERVGRSILRQIGHGASLDAGRIPQIFFDWYLALQRYTNTMHNEGEMIGRAATLRGFPPEHTLTEAELAAVSAPTLFLWGRDDPFGGEAVARRVVESMPTASLTMLDDSGHLPWLDDPEGVGEKTAAFLTAD
jgi:2-hydroxy-6-oxonona-2,4-dienedioate hydrolase